MAKVYIIEHSTNKACECGLHCVEGNKAYSSLEEANKVLDEIERGIDNGTSHHFYDKEYGRISVEKQEPIGLDIYKRELSYKWIGCEDLETYFSNWFIIELDLVG